MMQDIGNYISSPNMAYNVLHGALGPGKSTPNIMNFVFTLMDLFIIIICQLRYFILYACRVQVEGKY